MDLNDTPEQAAYREKVRAWLRSTAPRRRRALGDRPTTTSYVARAGAVAGPLAEAGLAGVTWPREYGGQGLGPVEQVDRQPGDRARPRARRSSTSIGVGMLGPTIIAHGTEEQKPRYLGPMLHGDEVWCQLFSEPAAGSDLAAVQTRARREDDGGWRLNGQKVWTTNAQFAAYGLLLARTDADVPKHKGLTMFIVPMDADGVTVRGLRQISGEAEFNEVFFDDVRARRRRRRRRGRRRLGHRADHAHVRAADHRPGLGGPRLPGRPASRARSRPTRSRAPTPTCAGAWARSARELLAVSSAATGR